MPAYPCLIVKDSYWPWPERDLAGSAIDFFMRAPSHSFHAAMRQIYPVRYHRPHPHRHPCLPYLTG